jgi:hypothetical protein
VYNQAKCNKSGVCNQAATATASILLASGLEYQPHVPKCNRTVHQYSPRSSTATLMLLPMAMFFSSSRCFCSW